MPDTKPPAHEHDDAMSELATDRSPASGSKSAVSPVVAMTTVIVLLLATLLALKLWPKAVDPEYAALQAKLEQLTSRSGSLPGLGGEQLPDIAKRMKKDADSLVLLADRYRQLIDDSNAELARKNADLVLSEGYRQSMTNDLVRLKNELQAAKSASYEAESLRREVADHKTQQASQLAEIADLKKQLAEAGEMATKEDLAALQARLDEALRQKSFFEARAAELTAALAKQQALFAKSEDDLLPAAVALFKTLRKLENQSDLEITKAYSKIGVELGAEVVKAMTFPTGSPQMNPADAESVRQLIAEVPDGDMLFVVGYASETGNVDANRTLSSDRATGVAELLTSVKRPDQKVQATYLGQTDRFGSRAPERNQCCEVWHIRAAK
jgi:outer membrane protein OmpA-like peptidoglycan-associated protein